MEIATSEQVYHILQNLNNLELSYLEYSSSPKNFVEYKTYLEFFNSNIIRTHDLYRFYFPLSIASYPSLPRYVSDLGTVTDHINIAPGCSFSVAKQFNFPNGLRHKCNYYTLIYLMEGQGNLVLDEHSFRLQAGDFYLVPPEVYYALTIEQEGICICFNMRKSFVSAEYRNILQEDVQLTGFITQSLESDSTMTYLSIHTDNDITVRDLALMIFVEYINQKKFSDNAMKNYLSLMFTTILRNDSTKIESSVRISQLEQQYQEIIDYLKRNYQTATLTDVTEQIHFSKQYICKIVKAASGQTFNTLLTNLRLEMVCQYLTESELSLEDIAELCGFSASSHLSKVFKSRFGETPSSYRKSHI